MGDVTPPSPPKNIPSPAKKRPNEKRSWRSSFEGGSAAALAGEEGDRGREEKGRGRSQEEGEFCHWRAGRTNGERRGGRKKRRRQFLRMGRTILEGSVTCTKLFEGFLISQPFNLERFNDS